MSVPSYQLFGQNFSFRLKLLEVRNILKISLPKCPESAPKCFFSKAIFNQKELLYQLLLLHRALCPLIRLSKSGFIVELAQRMSQWQPDEIVVLKFWDRGSSCYKNMFYITNDVFAELNKRPIT